jgi:hypothetical protein
MLKTDSHRYRLTRAAVLGLVLAAWGSLGRAQEAATIQLSIKDHRFQPAEVRAPANQPLVLRIKNLDPTPEEFESRTLRVEKVVGGGSEITIQIRPLNPGRYRFYGDYHEDTADGALIAE